MNQEKFLQELEYLLSDISQVEREEAMEYYRCYFEDAGAENEARVLRELGSPHKRRSSQQRRSRGIYGDRISHRGEKRTPCRLGRSGRQDYGEK